MAYVGILLLTILFSFIVVRIGGFALQLTGMEPEVARFQALSAFSGTGFTTTEAERVVQHRTRRRIVTILIILGNAGLVAIIATLVASFTQVTGYGWFFIRVGVIILGIFVLYRIIVGSRVGNRMLGWLQKPLMGRILREAPRLEEVFNAGKDWGVHLVMVAESSKSAGMSVAEIAKEGDLRILGIDRASEHVPMPGEDERILKGDRLLVYGRRTSVSRLLT